MKSGVLPPPLSSKRGLAANAGAAVAEGSEPWTSVNATEENDEIRMTN
jgi:hypothetical protein